MLLRGHSEAIVLTEGSGHQMLFRPPYHTLHGRLLPVTAAA